jgi:hypothetical protein
MNCFQAAAFFLLALPASAFPQEGKARGLAAWDTGKASAEALAPAALAARQGWTALEKDTPLIKGDAVLTNGRITAVVRRNGQAELYALPEGGAVQRTRVMLLGAGGDPVARFDKLALAEVAKGALTLEVAGKTSKGAAVAAKLRLKKGDPALETEPGAGASRLRVEAPTRYTVFPDFFADDIVIDAAKVPIASIEAPSENFLLHLGGKNDSIVMAVFENREQDVKLTLAGDGEKRVFTASDIEYGAKNGKIWVALMEGASIWHSMALERAQRGRVVPMGWKMPFRAYWRVDFTNSFELFDSWDMLLQEKEGGEFVRPTWFGEPLQKVRPNRQMFDAAIGGMIYPAYADPQGNGFVQGFNEKGRMEITHAGPLVVYPINRLPETPLEAFTVVDIMRNTLGVGPCEHILDVEGQKQQLQGRATCSVRVELNDMYEAKQQKARQADAEQFLKQGETFVAHIRGRINGYADYGHKMLQFLAAKKKEQPALAATLVPLEKLLGDIDASIASKMDKIKTPEDHAKLFAKFRKDLLGSDAPDAAVKCKEWCEALVDVGGTQDELVAHCRWVVKNVRQKAGLIMVQDPKAAPIATEVRAKAQEVLRNPSAHESARH